MYVCVTVLVNPFSDSADSYSVAQPVFSHAGEGGVPREGAGKLVCPRGAFPALRLVRKGSRLPESTGVSDDLLPYRPRVLTQGAEIRS